MHQQIIKQKIKTKEQTKKEKKNKKLLLLGTATAGGVVLAIWPAHRLAMHMHMHCTITGDLAMGHGRAEHGSHCSVMRNEAEEKQQLCRKT
jgi:hypothetical protein